MSKIETGAGACNYCLKHNNPIIYFVQLFTNEGHKHEYQEKIGICESCKKYLRGHFRYWRSKNG